jgi:hypothetical protein
MLPRLSAKCILSQKDNQLARASKSISTWRAMAPDFLSDKPISVVLPLLAPLQTSYFKVCAMNSTAESVLIELRIARAYVRLSSMDADGPKASVSLAKVGNCELRMFRGPENDFDSKALFWLELFDHGTRTSLDSCRCDNLKDATPAYELLMAQFLKMTDPDRAET